MTDIKTELSQIKDTALKIVHNLFKDFLTEYPMIAGIHWVQYTPGFNDGEPCEHTMGNFQYAFVNDPEGFNPEEGSTEFELIEVREKDSEGRISWLSPVVGYNTCNTDYKVRIGQKRHVEIAKALDDFINALYGIPSDVWVYLFGDNVHVKVTLDGITKTQYDCGY